jgi:hypothetical protein
MDSETPSVTVGCPEMWTPVYTKYKLLFDTAAKSIAFFNKVRLPGPSKGELSQVVARMLSAVSNTMGAILILAFNGYGSEALKLSRGIYETELNILWLKNNPGDVDDFVEFQAIRRKQAYDEMDEEQKARVPKHLVEKISAEYLTALPRFIKDGKDKPRKEWCRRSLHDRAREVGLMDLHRTYYREASSVHHGDVIGLLVQMDSEGYMDAAPSWSNLDSSLVSGLGSYLRCLNYFDEIEELGFKDYLEQVNAEYVTALTTLKR